MHEAINHAKLAALFQKEDRFATMRKGETVVPPSDLRARAVGSDHGVMVDAAVSRTRRRAARAQRRSAETRDG